MLYLFLIIAIIFKKFLNININKLFKLLLFFHNLD